MKTFISHLSVSHLFSKKNMLPSSSESSSSLMKDVSYPSSSSSSSQQSCTFIKILFKESVPVVCACGLCLWFVSFCISVFLYFCLSVFLSFCIHVCLSFCLSIWLTDWLSSCVARWLASFAAGCLSVFLSLLKEPHRSRSCDLQHGFRAQQSRRHKPVLPLTSSSPL